MILIKYIRLLLILSVLSLSGCSVNVTLSGASIDENLKTFSVQYFNNRAAIINPLLSQKFTELLKERIMNESRLILVNGVGDVDFSGEITGYTIRPMAIKEDAVSAQSRLTVTVKVRFQNKKNPQKNWESSFSAYQDFASDKNITEVEDELTSLIIDQLTENIFNKAFSDW
ncbi:MAG: LptE family protein [Chlorobi bacterium]|nr:LptE family protein [Chlorobiota bacterium]